MALDDLGFMKIECARRQLGTALMLFLRDEDPISVHCLATTACEILDFYAEKMGTPRFSMYALEAIPDLKKRELYFAQRRNLNSMKHAKTQNGVERTQDEKILRNFKDQENDHALFIGWSDYQLMTGSIPIEAQALQIWYFALYEEKLPPDTARGPAKILFPEIGRLNRKQAKRQLARAIDDVRQATDIVWHQNTEQRPLMLGWPPTHAV